MEPLPFAKVVGPDVENPPVVNAQPLDDEAYKARAMAEDDGGCDLVVEAEVIPLARRGVESTALAPRRASRDVSPTSMPSQFSEYDRSSPLDGDLDYVYDTLDDWPGCAGGTPLLPASDDDDRGPPA